LKNHFGKLLKVHSHLVLGTWSELVLHWEQLLSPLCYYYFLT
jgi:hypothetical protein